MCGVARHVVHVNCTESHHTLHSNHLYCTEFLCISTYIHMCIHRQTTVMYGLLFSATGETSRSNRACGHCGLSYPSSVIRRHEVNGHLVRECAHVVLLAIKQ